MKNDDMVSQEQFDSLRKDVKEIKGALLGNERFGQKGFVHKIEENEQRSWNNKHKIDRYLWYMIGAGGAIGILIEGFRIVL